MANIKESQNETLALVDTAKAMVDKVMSIFQLIMISPSLSLTFATNPIGFLLQLLKHLGITYEELRLWLTNFLIYVIPALEISVKAILLTNLKHMVSCSVDPRIPEKYRKKHKSASNTNTSQEYGIDINIESIDFLNKLKINPLSKAGSEYYFGLDGIDDVYKFARADDFDAFLWFVIHKGKFPMSAKIKNMDDFEDDVHGIGGKVIDKIEGSKTSLLEEFTVSFSNSPSSILVGNTFTYDKSSHVVSMCIDTKYDENNNVVESTMVPISDDWSSVNWYARKADQLGKNIGFGWGVNQNNVDSKYKGESRDFSDENAICNIQYIDQASSTAPITGLVNNKLRFTILPKPYVHIPNLQYGEKPTSFRKLLFNSEGDYDPNGKYTALITNEIPSGVKTDTSDTRVIDFKTNDDTICTLKIGTGEIINGDKETVVRNLIECYKGLTVYEFNYDYVMSLKLFDAKVLATTLLDSIINMNMGLNMGISEEQAQCTETIKEIIKNIINTDDSEISDCFYTFDNSKYDALLRKTEENREKGNKQSSYEEIAAILNEYNENAELHEQVEVLNRAITQASVTVSEGADGVDKADLEFNFVFDLVENLTMAIVSGVLSPKVLMLLEVNQQMMGGTWEKFSMADLIRAMQNVIVSIIKEIRDLIIQELLKLVLKQLEPLIASLSSILLREQLENYVDAIQDIIRNCPFIWFSFGTQDQETKLDTVDYADIDVSSNKEGEQPNTNNC